MRNTGVVSAFVLGAVALLVAHCDSSDSGEPDLPAIAGVVVKPDDRALVAKGQGVQLIITVTTQDGAPLADPPVVWSSSAPAVLTVSNAGFMRGQAAGEATITAAIGGKTDAVTFRVVDLTGTWTGIIAAPGVPPDTITYALNQQGTEVTGTYHSQIAFPPLTNNGTGPLTGTLLWDRYVHKLEITAEDGCVLKIEGAHLVRSRSGDALALEPEGNSALSSDNCPSVRGTILEATLTR